MVPGKCSMMKSMRGCDGTMWSAVLRGCYDSTITIFAYSTFPQPARVLANQMYQATVCSEGTVCCVISSAVLRGCVL